MDAARLHFALFNSMTSRASPGSFPLPKGCHRVWRTKQLDPRRGPMGLRRRDWRRPRPPPRMARTTRLYPATVDTRRTAVAVAAACRFAAPRYACTSSAADSGSSSLHGWRRPPPSDARKWPRDGYRGDSRPPSCAAPDSPGPRWARRDYPRYRRPRRSRMASRPSPAPAPPLAVASSRSETKEINHRSIKSHFHRIRRKIRQYNIIS